MALKYHEQTDRDNTVKLRMLQKDLPPFCKTFFRGIEPRTASRTRIAYAYDLHVFFSFLQQSNPSLQKKDISEITLADIDKLTVLDIEEYMEYLKYHMRNNEEVTKEVVNGAKGIKRKIASLKSFYNYFYRNQMIEHNPAALVSLPRLHQQDIIRLEANEVANLLDEVESGSKLTKQQQVFHEKNRLRDTAIMTLLLGTGIRVSECVGLNLQDIDFDNNGIRIHRKGGKEVTVYFGDEVETALQDYLALRDHMVPAKGHDDALFLSLQNKRLSVRSVELMVKKYATAVTPLKHITPHKLRSTYGTNLYKETGDIYLVADVLGHSDVNTTKRHYAALEDERRRSARNKVRLREE